MTEYKWDLRNLAKDTSEIILSDEQIDENGNVVREPVLIFAIRGERMGYMPVMELQSWIMHHIYAPEIKLSKKPKFPAKYND